MLPCSRRCHSSQRSLCYCVYPLIRLLAAGPCVRLRFLSAARPGSACWQRHSADVRRRGCFQSALCLHASDVRCVTPKTIKVGCFVGLKAHLSSPLFASTEEGCLPYSKPSFPSPGGHSSSGTASSKGSTGPRKSDGPRQPQQWTASEHAEFLGANGQGQYTGELCELFYSSYIFNCI